MWRSTDTQRVSNWNWILSHFLLWIFYGEFIAEDQKERERQLINEEMIPTGPSILSFWDKFFELHSKMMWHSDQIQNHLYASDPLDWPLMNKGIAYWVDKDSNVWTEFKFSKILNWINSLNFSGPNLFAWQHCHMVFWIRCLSRLLRSTHSLFAAETTFVLWLNRTRLDSIPGSWWNIFLRLCHPLFAILFRGANTVPTQLLAGVHLSNYASVFRRWAYGSHLSKRL